MLDRVTSSENMSALVYALNGHYLAHFARCYKLFNRDLESCIILGEIAHYNTSSIFQGVSEVQFGDEQIHEMLKGSNAHSISLSTGIPRETVRRKVKKLQKMGFVTLNENNQLIITKKLGEEFADFTRETLHLFFDFMNKIDRLK